MFCSSCGKPMQPESKFCATCGAQVAPVQSVPPGPPTPPPVAPPPTYQATPIYSSSPMPQIAPVSKPKMKLWKKIAIGVVVFIVAVIALAMWATSGLDEPVKAHFASIKTGNIDAAYSELSVAARQQTSLDDFKAMLKNVPALTKVTGTSFTSRTVENGQGKLEGVLQLEGGGKLPIDVVLVKENDKWKILAYKTHDLKSAE